MIGRTSATARRSVRNRSKSSPSAAMPTPRGAAKTNRGRGTGRSSPARGRPLAARPDPPDRAALENACARLLAAPTLPRTRDKGGRSVGYDLRPLVTSIDVLEAAPGRVAGLRIRTRFDPEKGVGRPEEVLAALSELAGTPLEATATIRERLLLADEANEA